MAQDKRSLSFCLIILLYMDTTVIAWSLGLSKPAVSLWSLHIPLVLDIFWPGKVGGKCVSVCVSPSANPPAAQRTAWIYFWVIGILSALFFLKILNHMQSNPRSTSALPSQCVRVCISWQSYPTRTPIICSACFLFFCFALHSSLSAKVSLVRLVFFYSCLSSLLKIKTAETKTR